MPRGGRGKAQATSFDAVVVEDNEVSPVGTKTQPTSTEDASSIYGPRSSRASRSEHSGVYATTESLNSSWSWAHGVRSKTRESASPRTRLGAMMARIRALDVRFHDKSQESAFKASLERELLRSMIIGCAIACMCSIVHGIITWADHEVHLSRPMQRKQLQILGLQQCMWLSVPLVTALMIALRMTRGCFRDWNWELLIVFTLMYGSSIIVIGQTHHLTLLFGEDPINVWDVKIGYGHEAWSLLGLNTLTTATFFFVPIRSAVSIMVPLVGVVAYMLVSALLLDPSPAQAMRIVILIVLAYIAWQGATRIERHLRTEWLAIRQVELSASKIEEQLVSIQNREEKIQEKALELEKQVHFAKSLHSVCRVFCDTIIHLDGDLRVRNTEVSNEHFFEQSLEGLQFVDFLQVDDSERFHDCVARASQAQLPECLPVTLHRKYTTSEVHLLILDTTTLPLRYMLGIRVEKDHPMRNVLDGGAAELLGGATASDDLPPHEQQRPSQKQAQAPQQSQQQAQQAQQQQQQQQQGQQPPPQQRPAEQQQAQQGQNQQIQQQNPQQGQEQREPSEKQEKQKSQQSEKKQQQEKQAAEPAPAPEVCEAVDENAGGRHSMSPLPGSTPPLSPLLSIPDKAAQQFDCEALSPAPNPPLTPAAMLSNNNSRENSPDAAEGDRPERGPNLSPKDKEDKSGFLNELGNRSPMRSEDYDLSMMPSVSERAAAAAAAEDSAGQHPVQVSLSGRMKQKLPALKVRTHLRDAPNTAAAGSAEEGDAGQQVVLPGSMHDEQEEADRSPSLDGKRTLDGGSESGDPDSPKGGESSPTPPPQPPPQPPPNPPAHPPPPNDADGEFQTSLLPQGRMLSIDENSMSDFSFTTYPKNKPKRYVPRPTSVKARAKTIRMILKRWTVNRCNDSCCHYHTVIASMGEALEMLFSEPCEPLFSVFPLQCRRCLCMNSSHKCVVCGHSIPES